FRAKFARLIRRGLTGPVAIAVRVYGELRPIERVDRGLRRGFGSAASGDRRFAVSTTTLRTSGARGLFLRGAHVGDFGGRQFGVFGAIATGLEAHAARINEVGHVQDGGAAHVARSALADESTGQDRSEERRV